MPTFMCALMSRLGSLLLWATACACKSDAERAHQGQVARLVEQIERLRRADDAHKRAPLQELERVPCPDAEACGLEDLCVRAYACIRKRWTPSRT